MFTKKLLTQCSYLNVSMDKKFNSITMLVIHFLKTNMKECTQCTIKIQSIKMQLIGHVKDMKEKLYPCGKI
jgi:hypothetical protein